MSSGKPAGSSLRAGAGCLICGVLGEHVTRQFISGAKKKEWEEYRCSVSSWEIDRYLARI